MRRISLLVPLLLTLTSGCGIFNTGPRMTKDIADVVKTTLTNVSDGLKAQQGNATVVASIENPTYRATIMVGPVWLIDVVLGLEGVELSGNLQASLVERVEADPELQDKLFDLISDGNLKETEKSEAVLELILGLLSDAEE